jgi:hypothetical protein
MVKSVVIIGWLKKDGTITYDPDEITNEFRKVVAEWKNSDYFLKSLEKQWEKQFK